MIRVYRNLCLSIVLVLVFPFFLCAQSNSPPWEPFKFFVGSWTGSGKGQPGLSKLEREYRFLLNGKYLEVKHKSTYAPQEKNPKGEVHEDLGLISYDRSRKKFVMRQFHVEGFVTQYVLESSTTDGKSFVFISEGLENIPSGWRARETYRVISENEFVELFELAGPGKEFELYSENHFKRQK